VFDESKWDKSLKTLLLLSLSSPLVLLGIGVGTGIFVLVTQLGYIGLIPATETIAKIYHDNCSIRNVVFILSIGGLAVSCYLDVKCVRKVYLKEPLMAYMGYILTTTVVGLFLGLVFMSGMKAWICV
jgi:hypothetical protein